MEYCIPDSGIKFTVRIISNMGDRVAGILHDKGEAREYAGELASLLAVPLRDRTAERETEEEDLQKVAGPYRSLTGWIRFGI